MLRKIPSRLLASLFLIYSMSCPQLPAQGHPEPVSVEDLVSALSLADDCASLSSDGEWLAYTVQNPGKTGNFDYEQLPFGTDGDHIGFVGSDVWIANTKSGGSTNVTGGIAVNWGPVWSPDGSHLAFYSTRSGKANLWIYDRKSMKLRQVSDVIVRPFERWQAVRWTADNSKVLTKVALEEPADEQAGTTRTTSQHTTNEEGKQPGSTAIVYRSSPRHKNEVATGRDDAGVVVDSRTMAEEADLAFIEIETGRVQRIARGFRPAWYDISPDGLQIAFATYKGLLGGNRYRNLFDLVVVSREGQTRVVASDIPRDAWDFSASWSPDGKWLSYITLPDGECYIVSVSGGSPQKAALESHPAFNNYYRKAPIWDHLGHDLYFLASFDALWKISLLNGKVREVAQIPGKEILSIIGPSIGQDFLSPGGGHSMVVASFNSKTQQYGFHRIDPVTGSSTELLKEDKKYDINQMLYSPTTRSVVYVAEDAGHEPDFWTIGADFKRPHQLTTLNPRSSNYLMGQSTLIEWKSLDGRSLRGALLLPAAYQKGKKYPLIVSVYGGVSGSGCLNCFGLFGGNYPPENKQLFASRGYAVLSPDAPLGSGTAMSDLAKTVLPGVDKVVELGVADPDKIGLIGVSYGGYCTLSLIVQSTRFRAAVMISGFGDLISYSGEMEKDGSTLGGLVEEQWWEGRMPGSLWKFRDQYINNSPVFFLDRVQTPLLILHGGSDRNVAPFLADQVFVFLRQLGRDVEYAKYEGEGHAISNYANQLDYCHRIVRWFDAYLKGTETLRTQQGRVP